VLLLPVAGYPHGSANKEIISVDNGSSFSLAHMFD
jgi:hypothetical protein